MGQYATRDIVSVGSGIVSWPSIHPGLDASQRSFFNLLYCSSQEIRDGREIHFIFAQMAVFLMWLKEKKKKELGTSTPDCPAKQPCESLLSHWWLYRLFPGKQQLFHCNECMHKCSVADHTTISWIMNTSDVGGKHFNLSKHDCMHFCLNGSAAVITLIISEREERKRMYLTGRNGLKWHW